MAEKYRDGTHQGTLRLDEKFYEEVKLETVRHRTTLKAAIEEGLKMWLGHIRGDGELQKSVGPLTSYEQKWCTILLSILRSRNKEAIAGTESILVLYARSVRLAEAGPQG